MGECAKADGGSAFTSLRVAPWAALGARCSPLGLTPCLSSIHYSSRNDPPPSLIDAPLNHS